MSTRGLVGIVINKEKKYMFNHWDSYPKGGLGEDVVDFCNKVDDWLTFKENAQKVKLVDEKSNPTLAQQKKYSKFLDKEQPRKTDNWYSLLMDLQGVGILEQIYRGKVRHMTDDKDFIKDSMFCEYAYIINLDSMKLELYRWGSEKVGEFHLTKIPQNWMEVYAE